MVRPIGSEKHLTTELVDALESPAVVVELGLRTQAPGLEAHMCEPGHLHHRDTPSPLARNLRQRPRGCTFQLLIQVWCSPIAVLVKGRIQAPIAARHGGISSWNASLCELR